MAEPRMLFFWIASLGTQILCVLSLIFFFLRHRPTKTVTVSALNYIKRKFIDAAQFPNNELGLQLQCQLFWILISAYCFQTITLLIRIQGEAIRSPAGLSYQPFNQAFQTMVYILAFVFALVCPKSVCPKTLTLWTALYMALEIIIISPLGLPPDGVDALVRQTVVARCMIIVMVPRGSVVAVWHVIYFAYSSSRLPNPNEIIFSFSVQGVVYFFVGFFVRFIFGEWAKVALELQSQKLETAALRSLLFLLCDAVVELDVDLNISEHSPQLSTLLLQASAGTPSAPSLKGLPLAKLLPSGTERERFEIHLRGHSQATASAFHTTMLDAMGNHLDVELLHISFSLSNNNRHLLVGIRESEKDTSSLKIDRHIVEHSQDERCVTGKIDRMLQSREGDHNPMLLFSLDTEQVVQTNQEWVKFIRPFEANCQMSEVLNFTSSNYDSFIRVLQSELNNLQMSNMQSSDDDSNKSRVVSFDNIPLAHFQGSDATLGGEVRLFETEDGTCSFGILAFKLEDVLRVRLLQRSSDLATNLTFLSQRNTTPRSASPRSDSPNISRSNSFGSSTSRNSRRSNSRRSNSRRSNRSRNQQRQPYDNFQPEEGCILELHDNSPAALVHL